MICWGELNSCAIFIDQVTSDRCDCLRDKCIRDYAPEKRIMVRRYHLNHVIDHAHGQLETQLMELDSILSIRTIPHDIQYDAQNKQAMDRMAQRLIELGFDVELVDVGAKEEGTPAHYMIFADYFSTPAKNVMLIYGHIDVLPVPESDPWLYPPFSLTQKNEKLYGRGLTNSKGPLMCWIQAIDAWMTQTNDLPVNIKFIIDGNSNVSLQLLRDVFEQRKQFFQPVDLLVSTTNLWIAENVPMLTTCHSGYVKFELEVQSEPPPKEAKDKCPPPQCECGLQRDPMSDLCLLLNTLTDTKQGILVKGLHRHLLPVTQQDWDIFCQVELGIQEYKRRTGATTLPHEQSHPEFLKHRWCMPSLTLHSVKCPPKVSTQSFRIPKQVSALFSVKLVPNQSYRYVKFAVKDHLDQHYKRLKCKNPTYLRVLDQLAPSKQPRNATFNVAAIRAYKSTYNVTAAIPDTVNVCMPIINELRRNCMKHTQVVGLPFCSMHMLPHQANESCTIEEYQRNIELFATYLYEIAHVPAECKCTDIPDFCYTKGKATETDFIRTLEPRDNNTHVLYEIGEMEIDRTANVDSVLPNVKQILLGKDNSAQSLV
ncbi:cytosolic non-specific dipeptidase-like [Drosophila albomicans]|uniref:Cytosolic non-specific dipeptidase-like n=1 Tax=Drosophila albomicans TaxID=7291 RepID=A0A6P8WP52_DROAB|nr:cytosolic non-specific dipeptidase-like [Drosophila albomicans]